MNHRWTRQAATFGDNLRSAHNPAGRPPSGLLLTCSRDCFAPALLDPVLEPGAWRLHRTPANVVPPRGAGFSDEENVLERAVADGVSTIVVCGHVGCGVLDRLLASEQLEDDFLMRDWLDGAEAARRAVMDSSLCLARQSRALVESNVRAQLVHLRTHPAVAASRVRLFGWVFDHSSGQLLCQGASEAFDRLAALDPEQNHGLRREYRLSRRVPSPFPLLSKHRYLA